jgi:hypothetical protein
MICNNYIQLKEYMKRFHRGEILKVEMIFAIMLWQEAGAKL